MLSGAREAAFFLQNAGNIPGIETVFTANSGY